MPKDIFMRARTMNGIAKRSVQDFTSQRGLGLVEVLVAVGLVSIIGLSVAAVASGIAKQLAVAKNLGAAEDLTAVVSSLLSDANYCALHFSGLPLSSVPSTVQSSVNLRTITSAGALSGTSIVNVGQVIDNRLSVDAFTLMANQEVAPRQYLGQMKIQLKPVDEGAVLVRTVSLFMQTDSTGKIASCSRTLQNPIDSARGLYSETCTDFAAKGWSSKQTCLQDGRWHRVFSNSASGGATFGNLNDLTDHIDGGAQVRIGTIPGTMSFSGFSDICAGTARYGGKLICMAQFRAGVPDWGAETLSAPMAIAYYSNGHLLLGGTATSGSSTVVSIPMHWWIKY